MTFWVGNTEDWWKGYDIYLRKGDAKYIEISCCGGGNKMNETTLDIMTDFYKGKIERLERDLRDAQKEASEYFNMINEAIHGHRSWYDLNEEFSKYNKKLGM